MWCADGKGLYYVSEQFGQGNIVKLPLAARGLNP